MAKPNIRHLYSKAKLTGSRALRSVSPGFMYDNGANPLQASYDNVNLKNHLPFADKSVWDVCRPSERFTTLNQDRLNKDALRQNSQDLNRTLELNNSLNRHYKTRLLAENHKLGQQSRAQEIDNLRSEQQDRQGVIRTDGAQSAIKKEIHEKVNAN